MCSPHIKQLIKDNTILVTELMDSNFAYTQLRSNIQIDNIAPFTDTPKASEPSIPIRLVNNIHKTFMGILDLLKANVHLPEDREIIEKAANGNINYLTNMLDEMPSFVKEQMDNAILIDYEKVLRILENRGDMPTRRNLILLKSKIYSEQSCHHPNTEASK